MDTFTRVKKLCFLFFTDIIFLHQDADIILDVKTTQVNLPEHPKSLRMYKIIITQQRGKHLNLEKREK